MQKNAARRAPGKGAASAPSTSPDADGVRDDEDHGATAGDAQEFSPLVYFIMMLLGLALLTPWNVVLNSIPYLKSLYTSKDAANFAFYVTSAYTYPGIPLLFLMVWCGHRLPISLRVLSTLLVQVAIMILIPLTAPASMWAPLALIFLNGLCTPILQSSLFGFTSHFPPIYNQAMMGGQGWAGVIASVSQIIVQASASASTSDAGGGKTAAIAYFVFAAAVLAGCAASYVLLLRLPMARAHMSSLHPVEDAGASKAAAGSGRDASGSGDEEGGSPLLSGGTDGEPSKKVSVWAVFKKIWAMAISIFLVFFMTFIIFPGVMDQIPYRGDLGASLNFPVLAANEDAWWFTILLAVFNVFDTVGRTLPARLLCIRPKWLLPANILRFGLVPLFVGCADGWSPAFNDAAAILILAAIAATNGYFASLAFMYAPSSLAAHEKETGGFLMSLFLNAGIVLGSQVALVFQS